MFLIVQTGPFNVSEGTCSKTERNYLACCLTPDHIVFTILFGLSLEKSPVCFGDMIQNCAAKDMLPVVAW